MTDELTEVVQPEGQGDAGTSNAPYAEYLARIPEQLRGDVEPIFKEWDANTTRRFQESAEFRKQWEPYQQVGVHEASPEAVQWALQFYQAAEQNPQAIQEWFQEYARERGLTPAEAQAELEQQSSTDEFAYVDPQVAELRKQFEATQRELQQLSAWREQQEQTVRMQEAERFVQSQLEELKAKHPNEFNQPHVERLVAQYIETDPQHAVQRAFADYQALRAELEKSFLESKAAVPPPAETGGIANGAPDPIRSLADANRIALEQLRGARQA